MDRDFDEELPRTASRSLSLDIARMAAAPHEHMPPAGAAPAAPDGGCRLTVEALALIRGEVPAEQKRLLYSNSLRRRSLEVDVAITSK